MKKLITITTDFGDSFAAAQLKAVIANLGFDGTVIENHDVAAYSIIEGAFRIAILAEYAPANSIHLGIVDPGVGSKCHSIIIQTKSAYFIGPDNGLLYPAAKNSIIQKVWRIQESKISTSVSHTFHGRDVFIKAAIYVAQNKNPENFGCLELDKKELVKISFEAGRVLHIDRYGNIKIFWPENIIPGEKLVIINKDAKFELPVVKTFSDVPFGKPLALLGSSGTLELAINLGDASRIYQIKTDDRLKIVKKNEAIASTQPQKSLVQNSH